MENRIINIGILKEVALALKELCERMVFVGGAVVSVYTDDPAADEVRPTKDIDMTINLTGFGEWTDMQERLGQLGFWPDAEEKVICRYKYKDILVDIMPAEDSSFGPSNSWYKPGFDHLTTYLLEDGLEVNVLPVSYFLATKFEAFANRGSDPRTSSDFEDIIYITDNRLNLVSEIAEADDVVRNYLIERFSWIYKHRYRDEIIEAQLSYVMRDVRLPIILGKIEGILNS